MLELRSEEKLAERLLTTYGFRKSAQAALAGSEFGTERTGPPVYIGNTMILRGKLDSHLLETKCADTSSGS